MSDEIREAIEAIIEPLREQLGRLDNEIDAAEIALDALAADRRKVANMIALAEGRPLERGAVKGRRKGAARESESRVTPAAQLAKTDEVRAFLANGYPYRDRIVASELYKAIRERRKALGRPGIGDGAVRRAIKDMHEAGELRLLGTNTPGGGPIYKDLRQ